MLLFERDELATQPATCWSLSDPGPTDVPDEDDDEQADPGGDSDPEPAS